ncbi:MAG TPA: sigma-70 family RNA polymerase sigma factor [Planctomycetaceae bacterium]
MIVASEELSDDRLLHDYVFSNSQEAFAVLVRRHGPMVWGVCRRVAGHTHDAEDAFQATFAVLARKAPSIRRRRAIGAWLHQVARRTSLLARTLSTRQGIIMDAVVMDSQVSPSADETATDRDGILDDEISRLPESLRLPVVLCYLQGLTNREAGDRLGCPEGTIVSRLARARELLRGRLVRRGLVLSSTAAVATLLTQTGSATSLARSLSQGALQCGLLTATKGALTSGFLTAGAGRLAGETIGVLARRQLLVRLGMVIAGMCVVGLFLGILSLSGPSRHNTAEVQGLGASSGAAEAGIDGADQTPTPLDGIWQGEDLEFAGGDNADEHEQLSSRCRWVISGDQIRFKWQENMVLASRYVADLSNPAGSIGFTIVEGPDALLFAAVPGLFEIRNEKLEVCSGDARGVRPPAIKPGVVAIPPADAVTRRAGLAGYTRLRRLDRSFEAEELQGQWRLVRWESGGADLPVDPQGRQDAIFDDKRYVMHNTAGDNLIEIGGTFTLEATQPAHFMKLQPAAGDPFLCLYEIQGDVLSLCMAAPGSPRPLRYQTEPGQTHLSLVLQRAKPDRPNPSTERPP